MDLDILVIAYHAKADLGETLASVAVTTSPGYRLTVYDNAVHNYPLSWLWNRFFEASGRSFVCLLNPDVILAPGWDAELEAAAQAQVDCGAYAPLSNCQPHREAFGSPVPDTLPQGGLEPLLATLRETYKERRFAKTQDHRMAPGHCAVIRREAWRKVGGFDERVPFAGNDYDFNARLGRAGMPIGVALHTAVFHKWNRSLNEGIRLGTFDVNSWTPRFSPPPQGRTFFSL